MFEPLYSLSKIAKRLESLSKAANDELAATLSRIRDHIITRMETISKQPLPCKKRTDCGELFPTSNSSCIARTRWSNHVSRQ